MERWVVKDNPRPL